MQAAAAAERERVERELARLATREAHLADELAAIRATRTELEDELCALDRFADTATGALSRRLRVVREPTSEQPPASVDPHALRGARIRETAVRVLAAVAAPDEPIHYRDWYELLTSRGFLPAGKDPLATFLTQIGRSPVVKRSTTAGTYTLDLEFPRRTRERLATLQRQLSTAHEQSADMSVEAIATARERRAALTTEIEAAARALEEALRSLGEPPPVLSQGR